jgi:spoIIIJ-associated protein
MSAQPEFFSDLQDFVAEVVEGLGLDLQVTVEESDDHVRIDLAGDDGEPLVRRKGEGLDALQHIVNSAFRHRADEKRIVVDCLDFRRSRDRELKQMVRFLIEKVRSNGLPQELGPLNSYSRRLVHMEVAAAGDMESESMGIGATKRVTIRPKRPAPPSGH